MGSGIMSEHDMIQQIMEDMRALRVRGDKLAEDMAKIREEMAGYRGRISVIAGAISVFVGGLVAWAAKQMGV